MHRLPEGTRKVDEDRLRIVWKLPNGELRIQGKRAKQNALTREEVRAYVKGGSVAACRLARERLGALRDAWLAVQEARGYRFGDRNPWMERSQ